ncbi:class C sortase [Alkalibacterium putridalgicola]|uniref:class C sortase n=1 Tax=Alkalibacterium putridalgicola TaxID=426703 RepID=UPI0034CE5D89
MKKYRGFILTIGLIIGFGFILYPFVSQLYYDREADSEVVDFKETVEAIDPPELKDENVRLAEAYNEALEPNLRWIDPYSEEEREEGLEEYAHMLEVREKIGIVNIPDINITLPLYAGSSESVLQRGVGHLEGTSLPVGGINTHSVITAHRGLPDARLFTDLDQMELGDIFYVESMAGELYYEVDDIVVVEPHETDKVKIVEGEDYLTLLTCTPYMVNSHRLLVRGTRISAPSEEVVEEIRQQQDKDFTYYLTTYRYYLFLIAIALIAVLGVIKWQ